MLVNQLVRWTRGEISLNVVWGSSTPWITCSWSCFWTLYQHWQCTLDLFIFISLSVYIFCRSLPSWTDVGTTFVGEQQHLQAHCAAPLLIYRSGEEEGGGKSFFSENTLVMLKSWYWLTYCMLRRSHFFTLSTPGNWCICGLESF